MLRPAPRGTELVARLGTRSARRVRFPKGREPPQGAATKPFGVRSLTTGSARGRLRKRRRPQTSKEAASTLGCAIAERFRSDSAPQFNKQEKLRWLGKGLRYRFGLS